MKKKTDTIINTSIAAQSKLHLAWNLSHNPKSLVSTTKALLVP